MELKPGYKQSEVGVIPKEWEVAKLGNLIEYTKGFAFKSIDYSSHGVRVVRVSDTSYDSILEECPVFVPESKASQYAKWRLRKDDLVISTVGSKPPMYDSMVGKVILIPQQHEGELLNQNAVLIRDKKRRTYFQQILLSHFRTKRYLTWIESIFRGNANQASITLNELFEFDIAFPSADSEQRAIAGALSDMDALLGALEQLIAKKSDLKQATMQQLLTGLTRLPGFHGKWEPHELMQVIWDFIVPMRDKPKSFRGRIPWCRIEDFDGKYLADSKSGQYVDEKTVEEMNLKVYPAGTLLVSCSADLGRCAIVVRPLVSNQTFIGLVMDQSVSSNEFFYYYMTFNATRLNNLSSGTTISYLSREQFESFGVLIPPTVAEQTAIAEVLTAMDAELAALEQRRDKTRALKQGMMQELLTGRTRLV